MPVHLRTELSVGVHCIPKKESSLPCSPLHSYCTLRMTSSLTQDTVQHFYSTGGYVNKSSNPHNNTGLSHTLLRFSENELSHYLSHTESPVYTKAVQEVPNGCVPSITEKEMVRREVVSHIGHIPEYCGEVNSYKANREVHFNVIQLSFWSIYKNVSLLFTSQSTYQVIQWRKKDLIHLLCSYFHSSYIFFSG